MITQTSTPLLKTKLYVPLPRANRVSRPHLLARLDEGLRPGYKLILVSVPAGFGKTTLLAEWCTNAEQHSDFKYGWLSLDEGDNDPVRFWAYFIAALQSITPEFGQAALTLLQATGWPTPAQTETLLTVLINGITGDTPTLVVLDDYHCIEDPAIHQGVSFLLDHLAPHMHLVIATRADPSLPLSRLRGRDQLLELRVSDLRFRSEEIQAFFTRSMGLTLSPETLATLEMQTEGWITALHMAALVYRANKPFQCMPDTMTQQPQPHHYVLDYLADEVFAQQPPAIQKFLLRTSILNQMCGPLCDAVVRGDESTNQRSGEAVKQVLRFPDSQAVLEYLEHANLFITALDGQRKWYCYHALFAGMLRKRLMQRASIRDIADLHTRASVWYEQHTLLPEAIEHALAAHTPQRAADLIETYAEVALARGENTILLYWIESLPETYLETRPGLCIFHAWALLLNGHAPDKIKIRLEQATAHNVTPDTQGAAFALQASLALLQGKLTEGLQLAQDALAQLHETRSLLRSIAANTLGMISMMAGDPTNAQRAFEQVVTIAQPAGHTMMTVAALCNLAGISVVRGQLHQAKAAYQHALSLSTAHAGQYLPVATRALLGLGELAREWNDLETAKRYLNEALTLYHQYGGIGSLVCYLTLGRIHLVQRDETGAQKLLDQARSLATASTATQMDDLLVDIAQVRIWIAQGHTALAAQWAERRGLADGQPLPPSAESRSAGYDIYEAEYLTLARLYLAHAQPRKVLATLHPLEYAAEQSQRTRRLIEILTLKALALNMEHRTGDALSALRRALTLAEPEGYTRVFVDEGSALAHLLYRVAEQDGATNYTGRLLAAFDNVEKKEKQDFEKTGSPDIVEPLSTRELEVLHLIAEGLSNRAIAERLFITLSTVKGHTSAIYGKLDVRNRTQAVARAREWDLLHN